MLIYLRPISRLTKLAFLTARATLKKNTTTATDINKSALCRIASLAFSFVTEIQKERTSRFYLGALSGPLVFVSGLGEMKANKGDSGP